MKKRLRPLIGDTVNYIDRKQIMSNAVCLSTDSRS